MPGNNAGGLGNEGGFDRAANDLYPTEAPVARALCEIEDFPGGVWECACGLGHLSKILSGYGGHDVISTDLVRYGFGRGGVDFLKTTRLRRPNIVTNPPFDQWRAFAQHAVDLGARKVVMLGRLMTLEDFDGRAAFFRRSRGWRVWSIGRSKMLPVDAIDQGMGGRIPFAWYVRDRAMRNEFPEIRWHKPRRGRHE